jgi:hypothetical protein
MVPSVRRVVGGVALLFLALWVAWWAVALVRLDLPLASRTWLVQPFFGADFWSQPDYAARMWVAGGDPYSIRTHLFHYPPIVIRLFLWTPLFAVPVALRIWVVVLAVWLVIATVMVWRERRALGESSLPLPAALALVLYSFPVVFQLERANFDLITLAAMLAALPLLRRHGTRWALAAEFAAGALLAIGPWVKIYPGFLGLGLLALRRYRAFGGFVVAGIAIFAAAPSETIHSFARLEDAIARTKQNVDLIPFGTWSHSLSMAWRELARSMGDGVFGRVASRIPGEAVALGLVLGPLVWVSLRVFRARQGGRVTFSYLLWVVAIASFVPQIANDYSLAFLPLAAVGCLGRREHWSTWVLFAIGCVSLQPFAFPISGLALLVSKFCGVVAVGQSVARHALEAPATT